MSDKQHKALRSLSTSEVEQRCAAARDKGQVSAFWRYYFELTLRKLEETAKLR